MLLFPTPDSPSKTSFICFDFPSGRALTTGGPEVRPFGRLFELMSMICKINLKKKNGANSDLECKMNDAVALADRGGGKGSYPHLKNKAEKRKIHDLLCIYIIYGYIRFSSLEPTAQVNISD